MCPRWWVSCDTACSRLKVWRTSKMWREKKRPFEDWDKNEVKWTGKANSLLMLHATLCLGRTGTKMKLKEQVWQKSSRWYQFRLGCKLSFLQAPRISMATTTFPTVMWRYYNQTTPEHYTTSGLHVYCAILHLYSTTPHNMTQKACNIALNRTALVFLYVLSAELHTPYHTILR